MSKKIAFKSVFKPDETSFCMRFFEGKAFLVIFVVIFLPMMISIRSASSEIIDENFAGSVARAFLVYIDEPHTVSSSEPVERSGQTIAYLFTLDPVGYILVAGDTIRVPVKAYSLKSDFNSLPPAYVNVILDELELPDDLISHPEKETYSSEEQYSNSEDMQREPLSEDVNKSYWELLTNTSIVSKKSFKNYTPDTFLLTTTWNQGYPYNKFTPRDGGELTVTGCVQTAVAQVMRYHAHPSSGSGVFTHIWNGQTLTAFMNRPFNWSAMPDAVTGNVDQYQQDEVAALMRDLGVLNEAEYGTDGTSAWFHYDDFERAFGYAPVYRVDSSDNAFFTTIISEIDNDRPVLLSMPGHMTVADGYATDGTGKKIHVNLGWGGAYDDYYYLDQTNLIGDYSFSPEHTVYYNIKPCQGGECNPYTSTSYGNIPVISSQLDDIVIDEITTLRIDVYDSDGDTVTLSAVSSSDNLQVVTNGNLLTLNPYSDNIFCEVTLTATSHDGESQKSFKVLVLENRVYMGTQYDIGGEFSDGTEIDSYSSYLQGNITVSGYRGYSNQAFYVWLEDGNGNIVIDVSEEPVSGYLTAGLYNISTSLENPVTHSYYSYDADFSGYTLTVTCDDLSSDVADLADSMGIELTDGSTELPENITSYKVLTDQAASQTVNRGDYFMIFGSSGINNITVESGGRMECVNFVGANEIIIKGISSDFTVSRSGAAVSLESSVNGTRIKIPATTTDQKLIFDDEMFSLGISGGRVFIGSQEITTTELSLVYP
ncbi:Peptidase C10 streptopain [Desulfamplus magnetovallimortis]|uniref:Peptidase C10 streptopain n=1 Tax=Desulfamplus magnetovallimortis TaxID=1246637 RepID=A0A1W1HKR9_9BACT|nr:C10 family peptidase [Desulfamplus magnetovallimortis]SLM33074.1 Peptidase C10 streptopain [Desulfamplus magnetovallimortis]